MRNSVHRRILTATLYAVFLAWPAAAGVIYDSIPGLLPPNVPSLGYQATGTSEFGDMVDFGGTTHDLTHVTVVLSAQAAASAYNAQGPSWEHAITLNLYSVDNSGTLPELGPLIATRTATFDIPWRPEADSTCAGWRALDGYCYSGLAFTVSFNFTGITVPDQIVYGVAFNTDDWGYNPIGLPGPYESLNLGLSTVPPSVGGNPLPDTAYWNTTHAAFYADGGAGGVGVFRADTKWAPYQGAIRFEDAAPEPGAGLLLATGLLALAWRKARARRAS